MCGAVLLHSNSHLSLQKPLWVSGGGTASPPPHPSPKPGASRPAKAAHAAVPLCTSAGNLQSFFPQLRVQQPIYSFTDTHSTCPTRANFSAHGIWCGLHTLQLQEPWAYVKTQLAFLYFK